MRHFPSSSSFSSPVFWSLLTILAVIRERAMAGPAGGRNRREMETERGRSREKEGSEAEMATAGTPEEHRAAVNYLHQFGFLSSPIPTPAQFREALGTFQDMVGLPPSGELDARTVAEMRKARCGNEDRTRGSGERRRRFVYISRWEDKVRDNELRLKWYLHNYTPDMNREEIRNIVAKTFHIWSSQAKMDAMESLSLVFEEAPTEAEADITILWAVGDHGDAHKFDDAGADGSNILAHTFYPNYQYRGTLNGDIHLDDFEQWNADGSREGASFPHVLIHEIGHTLGLGHSKKPQAIMFPIYRKEQLDLMQLDVDDKCAINWSYMGATDLCLYIWMLSEVLPKKLAPEKEVSTNMLADDGSAPLEDLTALRLRLSGLAMPECGPGPGGRMRTQLADLLRRRLSFPRTIARDYASVLCQFFDAFRREFDLQGTTKLHEVIRLHGVHSYYQPEGNFDALERALGQGQRRKFDSEFFRQLMATFLAG